VVADPVDGPLFSTVLDGTGGDRSDRERQRSRKQRGAGAAAVVKRCAACTTHTAARGIPRVGGCSSRGEEVRSVHDAHSCSRNSTGGAATAVTNLISEPVFILDGASNVGSDREERSGEERMGEETSDNRDRDTTRRLSNTRVKAHTTHRRKKDRIVPHRITSHRVASYRIAPHRIALQSHRIGSHGIARQGSSCSSDAAVRGCGEVHQNLHREA
jgi:hypothetical protein